MSILAIVSTAMAPLDRELPYRATGGRDADNASRAASAG